MSKVISLMKYKEKNYKYVWVYFNIKEECYWVSLNNLNLPIQEKNMVKSKNWKLIYEGLLKNEEIKAVEQGQPLSKEYGMYK